MISRLIIRFFIDLGYLPATIIHLISGNIPGTIKLKVKNTQEVIPSQDSAEQNRKKDSFFVKRKKTDKFEKTPFFLPDYDSFLASRKTSKSNERDIVAEEWFSDDNGGKIANSTYCIDLTSIGEILAGGYASFKS